MRILIDECLSQKLVAAAKMRDHDATHVVFLGKKGWQDYNLMDLSRCSPSMTFACPTCRRPRTPE